MTVVACARSEPGVSSNTARDSAGVQIVESSGPRMAGAGDSAFARVDSIPLLTIGVEEGEEAYQLHRVTDAFRFPDGRVAVSNAGTQQIRLFDSTGTFLRNVGRRGAGPGEFAEFSSASLYPVGDSLLATDNNAFRLHLFGPDMNFVETRPFAMTSDVVRPFMAGVFDDGTWLALTYENGGRLSGPPNSVLRMSYTLSRFDAHGALRNRITTADAQPRYVHQFQGITHFPFIPLTASPLQAVADSEVYLLRGARAELEVLDRTGRLVRIVRWRHATTPSNEVWSRYKQDALAGITNAQQRALYEDYYSLDLPLPEFIPAYDLMRVDDARRVWLRRYRLPWEEGAREWDVIAADGAWLGTAASPDDFTPFRIGDDTMLGVQRDSLGVERVQLLRLHVRATGS